jgi:hypothetical protein
LHVELAAACHAVFVLLAVLLFAPLLSWLPMPAFAALLFIRRLIEFSGEGAQRQRDIWGDPGCPGACAVLCFLYLPGRLAMLQFSCRCLMTILVVVMLCTACNNNQGGNVFGASGDLAQVSGDLPSLPLDKEGAGLTEYLIDGIAVFDKSNGAIENGTVLELPAVQSGYEWAVYAFDPQSNSLDSVALLLNVAQGGEVWIGLADYSAGQWELSGPFDKGQTLALTDGDYLSPGGILYVAVLAAGSGDTSVSALSVRTINPNNEAPVAVLQTGPGEESGTPPHSVHFDASASTDDAGISHYLWDLDGDGSFEDYSYSPSAERTYTSYGTVDATVSVVDEQGAHGEASLPIDINSAGWRLVVVDDTEFSGDFPSLAEVDGRPAISYWNDAGLAFACSGTPYGGEAIDWKVVSVHAAGQLSSTSLAMLGGRPAIAYFVLSSLELRYASSVTSAGDSGDDWLHALVASTPTAEVAAVSLAQVAGTPAIGMSTVEALFAGEVTYARSSSPSGLITADWIVVTVQQGLFPSPSRISLAVVEGNPALAYYFDGAVRYVRSSSVDGMTLEDWGNKVAAISSSTFESSSMVVAGAAPAIVAQDSVGDNKHLLFAHSATSSGEAEQDWDSFILDESSANIGDPCSMAQVAGRPAVAYLDVSNDLLKLAWSDSPEGSDPGAWEFSVVDDSAGMDIRGVSLAEINGRPAVAYSEFNTDSLHYAVLY